MTYFINFISLIWRTLVQNNCVHYLLIVMCLILLGILYYVIQIKLDWGIANYKITSFTWNIVGVLIYILCYIVFFLFLRMLRIGQTLDLKKFKIFMDIFMSQNNFNKILLLVLSLILILLWILLFIRVRDILIREILKLHFYQKNKFIIIALQNDTEPEFQRYKRFLKIIEKYTLENML